MQQNKLSSFRIYNNLMYQWFELGDTRMGYKMAHKLGLLSDSELARLTGMEVTK